MLAHIWTLLQLLYCIWVVSQTVVPPYRVRIQIYVELSILCAIVLSGYYWQQLSWSLFAKFTTYPIHYYIFISSSPDLLPVLHVLCVVGDFRRGPVRRSHRERIRWQDYSCLGCESWRVCEGVIRPYLCKWILSLKFIGLFVSSLVGLLSAP